MRHFPRSLDGIDRLLFVGSSGATPRCLRLKITWPMPPLTLTPTLQVPFQYDVDYYLRLLTTPLVSACLPWVNMAVGKHAIHA